jgi:hypothetical protein
MECAAIQYHRLATLSGGNQEAIPAKAYLPRQMAVDLLPFQARMHQYGQSALAGCPDECQDCDSEDHAHLLHCPAEHRVELFIQLFVDIETLCDTHRIDPNLYQVDTEARSSISTSPLMLEEWEIREN